LEGEGRIVEAIAIYKSSISLVLSSDDARVHYTSLLRTAGSDEFDAKRLVIVIKIILVMIAIIVVLLILLLRIIEIIITMIIITMIIIMIIIMIKATPMLLIIVIRSY
jgi:hypothetical protein